MIYGGKQRVVDQEKASDDWMGLTSSYAFPDVYAFSFRIPNTTLCVEIPVNVNFPNSRCVADYGGHR